ncbi:hypothetical protein DL96DRAFT_1620341 [Flagelloscypha sp. PMI_526]|nr:hypothetical protein DL96DRAFT_1620341 [Flagelloscypha sp. PMI_526]
MSAGTSSITIVQARIDMRQDPPKLWHEFITTYLPLGVLDIFGLHLKATPASRTAHFDSLLSQLAATALDGLASIVTHQILLDPNCISIRTGSSSALRTFRSPHCVRVFRGRTDMRDALVRANVTKLVVAAIRIFEINKREQEVVPVENRQRSLMSATVQLMDVLCDYGMNLPRIVRHIRKGFLPALFPKLPLLWEVNPTDRDYFSSVFTRLFIDNIDKYSVFDATTNALFRMARKGDINVAFLIRRTPPIVASACDSFISSIEIISRDVAENLVPTFTLTKVCHYTKLAHAVLPPVYCDSVCQRLGRRTHECFPSWTIPNVEPPAESLSYRQQWSHRCHITRIAVSWILKARMAEARDQVQNIFTTASTTHPQHDLVFDDEEYDDKPEEVDWTEKPRPMFAKEIDLIVSRPEDVVHVFVRYRDEEKVLANIHAYMRKAWFFGPVKPGLRKNGLVFQ